MSTSTTNTGKAIQGIHDPAHFPSAGLKDISIDIAEPRMDAITSHSGNYYDIVFPFSAQRVPNASTAAFEKTMVYLGLIVLLVAVAFITPVIVLVQLMERKAAGDNTSWLTLMLSYIPQVIYKETGVCLGLITIPVLFVCNVITCALLSVKQLF